MRLSWGLVRAIYLVACLGYLVMMVVMMIMPSAVREVARSFVPLEVQGDHEIDRGTTAPTVGTVATFHVAFLRRRAEHSRWMNGRGNEDESDK